MRIRRVISIAAAVCAVCALPKAAHAQFGYNANPGFTATARHGDNFVAAAPVYGSVYLYPVSEFNTAGSFSTGTSGTKSAAGSLVGANVGFQSATGRKNVEVGGWFWTKGSGDLYQVDVLKYVAPEVAVQAATIGSTSTKERAYSFYGIYELDSRRVAPTAPRSFGFQIAPGLYMDTAGGTTTYSFTSFVQGSYQIGKNLSLDASQWYIRDRGNDLTRFSVGVAMGF